MAVIPAKRARLNRARASRHPVIHGRRVSTNCFGYWIPALARRAKPGSLGRNDRQGCCGMMRSPSSEPYAIALKGKEGVCRDRNRLLRKFLLTFSCPLVGTKHEQPYLPRSVWGTLQAGSKRASHAGNFGKRNPS